MKEVYFAPDTKDKIISANKFNEQFHTSITLNTKTGSIYSRKLNSKLTSLEVNNSIYYLHAKMAISNSENYSVDSVLQKGKLYCHLSNVEIDPDNEIHYLPLNVNNNNVEEGELNFHSKN